MSRIAKVGTIAGVGVRRMWRDRSNRFSMVILPILLVLLIGVQFGGEQRAVVVVSGPDPVTSDLVGRLEADDSVEVERADDAAETRDQVADGDAALGVVLPADVEARLAAGEPLELEAYSGEDGTGSSLGPLVTRALGALALVPSLATELTDGRPDIDAAAARAAVEVALAAAPATEVTATDAGGGAAAEGRGGRFADGAAQQLTLITFLTTLLSAGALVQARQLGLTHRMLATPTSVGTVVVGEVAARWAVAVAQGAYIIVVSGLVFGVAWGNPLLAAAVLAAFGLVGAGLGMILGGLLHNENVVAGLGLLLGLGVGALGGAMLPVELFPSGLVAAAELTPHDRALSALAALRDGAAASDVLVPAAQLAAAAVVLVAVGALVHLRVLTRSR